MRLPSVALVVILLTVSQQAAVTNASDSLSERDILQEFFQATNGESWNNYDGWDDNSEDYCSWYGVICEDEQSDLNDSERNLIEKDNEMRRHRSLASIPENPNGKVIALKLKNNNIQGRLPSSFWKIPNLRILVLTDNPVEVAFVGRSETLIELKMHQTKTATVTGISNYPNLLALHMSSSPFGPVEFPAEIFKLTNLEYLHMAECQMEGTLPSKIFDLAQLKELNLYNNEFTGLIPVQIQVLSNLRLLNLSSNHLRGPLPEILGSLLNLQELYLEFNMFTGQLLAFNSAPNLRKLYLDGNELTGEIPSNFLQNVVDNGNRIYVNLDNNELQGTVPDSLDTLQELPLVLTLAGNKFTGFASNALCDNLNWMEGEMATSGCNAILCPVGTYAPLGRHTSTSPCSTCKTGLFLGQMNCLEQDDRSTLKFLYAETGGDHWINNNNWMDDNVSVCDWYGVHCYKDGENHVGRVKSINLSNNGLIGTISGHIFALELTGEIDLSWNRIEFPFEDISLTKHLNVLNVGHTDTSSLDGIETAHSFFKIFMADRLSIDGTIPSQIYQNTDMTILSLNNCGLSGSISTEIGKMTNLKELYLWGNNLQGKIPSEMGLLTKLSIITLANNKLTGTLPKSLENLVALEAFTVKDQVTKGGGITGDLLSFQFNKVLSNLILSGNKFSQSIPETLLSSVDTSNIPGTLIIDLSGNQLTGSVPGSLAKFDLVDLFVHSNYLTSVNPQLCGKLDWMSGSVGDFGCDAILCPKFTASPLGRQAFGSIACESCPNPDAANPIFGQTSCTAQAPPLTEREILEKLFDQCGGKSWTNRENWLASSNVCEWYGISCDDAKSVVSIVLGANNMIGTIPQEVYLLPNLQRFSVFSNQVDVKFDGIAAAVNLRALIMDDTELATLNGLGMARGLTELNIRSNGLKGSLPDEIADLNNLLSLIVADNEFTGSLPLWLNNLNKLTSLMFNNNQFSGTLLPFENFPDLTLLSGARNKLSGTIPDNLMASAPRDETVFCDLSANMLTGTVPGSLTHLNKLTLHLNDNRIDGIPRELCRMAGWNGYEVEKYGCNGLMCPPGTFNPKGRQSSEDSPCDSCDQNKYYGSTKCSSSMRASALSSLVLMGGFFTSVMMWLW